MGYIDAVERMMRVESIDYLEMVVLVVESITNKPI